MPPSCDNPQLWHGGCSNLNQITSITTQQCSHSIQPEGPKSAGVIRRFYYIGRRNGGRKGSGRPWRLSTTSLIAVLLGREDCPEKPPLRVAFPRMAWCATD